MIFVLDTDIVTLLHANNKSIVRRLEACSGDQVAITFDGLLKAATDAQFLHAQKMLQETEAKLNVLPVLFLNEGTLQQFRRLSERKGLRKIGRADLLIAGIALAHHATLVTRNQKHFTQIPQLKTENWVD